MYAKQKLLKLARQAIEEPDKEFKTGGERRGVFVTLKKNNGLRGCIGIPEPIYPVEEAIVKAARSAAFSDPRFSPVDKDELKQINIEISILSSIKECKVDEIKIGKDGLIIEYLGNSALLLPQVATEWKMSKKQFLQTLCQKAGLSPNAWKNSNAKLFKFQCEVFSE